MSYQRTLHTTSAATEKQSALVGQLRASVDKFARYYQRLFLIENAEISRCGVISLGLESSRPPMSVSKLRLAYLTGNKDPRTKKELDQANALEKEVKECKEYLGLAMISYADQNWYFSAQPDTDKHMLLANLASAKKSIADHLEALRAKGQEGKTMAFRFANDPIYLALLGRMKLYDEVPLNAPKEPPQPVTKTPAENSSQPVVKYIRKRSYTAP